MNSSIFPEKTDLDNENWITEHLFGCYKTSWFDKNKITSRRWAKLFCVSICLNWMTFVKISLNLQLTNKKVAGKSWLISLRFLFDILDLSIDIVIDEWFACNSIKVNEMATDFPDYQGGDWWKMTTVYNFDKYVQLWPKRYRHL